MGVLAGQGGGIEGEKQGSNQREERQEPPPPNKE